ncbi:peptidoglycan D,D-transpeptidase FtsI family protein [Staphylococcus massiliensis]|uniref:Penicillin-binding protein 3 n=1 Tax=Staphylococcus massiliensis S46 TaxID=1229783 RepID=K9AR46_9STAP|nr:penicillin-binding protein 2 [Staphylococcus massiliensis]EKU49888.1 penicillin-binding protein 3 [Staphylococcus massiliensis S46]
MLKRLKEKSYDEKNINKMNKRINFIFGIAIFIFAILVLRLGYLQIAQGSHYSELIKNSENLTVNEPVPRGRILDRNGNVLVDNASKKSITYTRNRNSSPDEVLETAEKLSKLIEMDTSKLTPRDKQDYWIQKNPEKAKEIVKKEEQMVQDGSISQEDYDKQMHEKIPQEELDNLSDKDKEVAAIFSRMMSGTMMDPQTIKNEDVTEKEYAAVSQQLSNLSGVNTSMDWDRKYPYDETLREIFGNVSSEEEGVPKGLLNEYLSKGYSRNDRVGKTYLEYQYENILKGKKKEMKYTTDKSGSIIDSEVIHPGSRGDDLVLSIDIKLQQKLEELMEKHIKKLRSEGAKDMDKALMVVQNPKTGEVLALSGKQIEKDGTIKNFDYGTFSTQYTVGSSVKGATLLAGYQNGAIKVGEQMIDTPMIFNGGLKKSSYFNKDGSKEINDAEALMHSSNVYMFKTALKLAGYEYKEDMPLPSDVSEAGIKLRKGLNQVGLGVKTGLDLPNEVNGQIEPLKDNPGNYLDLSIGQYDTYTPFQLAQYASTVGNGGYRIQPHIGKEIRKATNKDELGPVKSKIDGNVLNKINNSDKELNQVQKGFDKAFNDINGTGYMSFHDTVVPSAGKTGTAEVFLDGEPRVNSTYVGYAPKDDPELAFSIVYTNHPVPEPFLPGGDLGRDIINYYFKEEKEKEDDPSSKDKKTEQSENGEASSENGQDDNGESPSENSEGGNGNQNAGTNQQNATRPEDENESQTQ